MTQQHSSAQPENGAGRSWRDRLWRLTGVLLLIAIFTYAWFRMEYDTFLETPLRVDARGAIYEVKPGRGLRQIASELERHGILRHPRYLEWYARWHGLAGHIQAGEYLIRPGMTAPDLLQAMVAGKTYQYALTLVEGWTFREMMHAIQAHEALQHTLPAIDADTVMRAIGRPGEHPEGRFLPETYHFPRGMRDTALLKHAYRAMQATLERLWPERDEGLPLKSPYEAIILASIVEKETGLAAERPRIAGVFIRRLRKGMRLQTDPTVIYGLGESFDGDIRFRDLKRDTPYNTYTRGGLPPTPIAMPGVAALEAVLHPAPGEELYFVARGDGSHHFSATLEEHRRAVRKYQLKQ